jgi:hypothetical protein
VIHSTEINAPLYVYEMHQERLSNGTHQSYFVDYNGFTINPEQVNSAYLYTLLPYKDTQKYGDYWAILRKRPGAAAVTIPEYMPNKQHRYKEVLRDFERAGLTSKPVQGGVHVLVPLLPLLHGKQGQREEDQQRPQPKPNSIQIGTGSGRKKNPASIRMATGALLVETSTQKKQWPCY